jgi:hypothetical protein
MGGNRHVRSLREISCSGRPVTAVRYLAAQNRAVPKAVSARNY